MSFLDRLLGRRREPVPLTLFTRAGCHLCDVMKEDLARAGLDRPHALTEVDVDTDRKLKKLYGARVPVLAIGGRVAFEGRLELETLRREFARRAEEWERARSLARALSDRKEARG